MISDPESQRQKSKTQSATPREATAGPGTTPQLCTEGSDGFCCFNAARGLAGPRFQARASGARRAQRRDCRAILFVAGLSASLVALSLRFISYSLSAVLISLSAVPVRHRSTFPKRSPPRDYRQRPPAGASTDQPSYAGSVVASPHVVVRAQTIGSSGHALPPCARPGP
jgi:hypothetical protein